MVRSNLVFEQFTFNHLQRNAGSIDAFKDAVKAGLCNESSIIQRSMGAPLESSTRPCNIVSARSNARIPVPNP